MDAEHPLLTKLTRALTLSDTEAAAVRAVRVQPCDVVADQIIARHGDRPSRSFLLMDGRSCASKVAAGGKRQIMTLHIPGDAPDLQTLHLGLLDCDLWAISDCRLAFMPHDDLRMLNRAHPRLGEELWRTTLLEGAIYREWIVNVGQRQAPTRMAHLLCELMLRMEWAGLARDRTCTLSLTQFHLSEMTGLSVIHVNRTIQALRGQGLIHFGKGELAIHDWDALAQLGEFRPDYLHLRPAEAAKAA